MKIQKERSDTGHIYRVKDQDIKVYFLSSFR